MVSLPLLGTKMGKPFLKQDRPEKVKEIYKALKRDHPDMPAEMKARIAARQGKPGKQKQGPPYKGEIMEKKAKVPSYIRNISSSRIRDLANKTIRRQFSGPVVLKPNISKAEQYIASRASRKEWGRLAGKNKQLLDRAKREGRSFRELERDLLTKTSAYGHGDYDIVGDNLSIYQIESDGIGKEPWFMRELPSKYKSKVKRYNEEPDHLGRKAEVAEVLIPLDEARKSPKLRPWVEEAEARPPMQPMDPVGAELGTFVSLSAKKLLEAKKAKDKEKQGSMTMLDKYLVELEKEAAAIDENKALETELMKLPIEDLAKLAGIDKEAASPLIALGTLGGGVLGAAGGAIAGEKGNKGGRALQGAALGALAGGVGAGLTGRKLLKKLDQVPDWFNMSHAEVEALNKILKRGGIGTGLAATAAGAAPGISRRLSNKTMNKTAGVQLSPEDVREAFEDARERIDPKIMARRYGALGGGLGAFGAGAAGAGLGHLIGPKARLAGGALGALAGGAGGAYLGAREGREEAAEEQLVAGAQHAGGFQQGAQKGYVIGRNQGIRQGALLGAAAMRSRMMGEQSPTLAKTASLEDIAKRFFG